MRQRLRSSARALVATARRHPNLTALAVCIAITIAFFWPVIAQDRDFSTILDNQKLEYPWRAAQPPEVAPSVVQADQAALSYPFQVELNRRVEQGTLPFWARNQMLGGYPLYSNSNSAQLYPAHLVPAFLGWSAQSTHEVWCALHLTLAGWFCFMFLRQLRRSWWASLLGGVSWMLSSFNIAWLHFEAVSALQALLPASLALAVRAHRKRTVGSAVALGAVLALMMLSGHMLWMGISCLVAGGYALALAIEDATKAGREERFRTVVAALRGPLIAGVVAAGLSAIALLPTVRTLGLAQRAAFSYDDAYATDAFLGGRQLAPPTVLYRLFVPWAQPLKTETLNCNLLFAGTVTGAFAVLGAFQRRVRGVAFGRVTMIVCLLGAIGGPVTWIMYQTLPVMRVFRPYGRLLQWSTIGLVVLAATGFDRGRELYRGWMGDRSLPAVLRPAVLPAALVVVTVVQLLVVGRALNPTFPPSDPAYRFPSTPLTDAMESYRDSAPWPARMLPVTDLARFIIPFSYGNQNMVFDVDTVFGYDSVVPARNWRMIKHLVGQPSDGKDTAAAVVFAPMDGTHYELLTRLGISAVITGPGYSLADGWGGETRRDLPLREVYDGPDGGLATLEDGVGPHVVGTIRSVPDADSAFSTFVDPSFDWQSQVVLEPEARDSLGESIEAISAASSATGSDRVSTVEVTHVGANDLHLTVETDAAGLLVIPATWDPGWRATLDGDPVPLVQANYVQAALVVPAGRSAVVLRYRPDGIVPGAIISVSTAVLALGAVAAEQGLRRRHRRRVQSGLAGQGLVGQ